MTTLNQPTATPQADEPAHTQTTGAPRSKMSEALARCHSFGGIAFVGFVLTFFSWQCGGPPPQTTPPPPPNSAEVSEGSALEFAVALTRPADYADVVTVDYAAAGATADVVGAPAGQGCGDGDYDFAISGNGTLVWPAGDSSDKSVIMTACDDRHHPEADETVTITLSNQTPTNVEVDPDNASGIIKSQEVPEVTISDATVSEEAGPAQFLVSMSRQASSDVTVAVTTSDGTALAGSDYTTVIDTITISAGLQSVSVPVSILDDPVTEPDEEFTLTISNPSSNANLGSATTATGTIQDNDTGTPTAVQNLALACSGPDSLGEYTLTATWDPPHNGADGYSSRFSDRQYSWDFSGWYTFGSLAYGVTNTGATTTPPGSGDYWVFVTPFRNGGGFEASAGVTCDSTPEVTVGDAPDVGEGGTLVFTVSLSATSSTAVTVEATAVGDTATEGDDFLTRSGTVTIPANTTSVDVTVTTVSDTDDELDEALELRLSSPSGARLGLDVVATGRILDDDEPSVSITSPPGPVDEDTGGVGNALDFTVALDRPPALTVTVVATTSSGTAAGGTCGTTGVDYASRSSTVTFLPGDVSETFTVQTCPDAVVGEGIEDFTVTLSSPSNAVLGTTTATGEIDDTDDVTVSITGPAGPVDEDTSGASNSVVFAIRLDVAAVREVTVMANTSAGTASGVACASGGDFLHRSMTVRFNPGDTAKSFDVRTCADTVPELDESLTVTLSAPTIAVLGTSSASATIADNDEPTVSITGPASAVGEDTNGVANTLTFAVSLDVAGVQTVTVNVATSSGSATGGTCGSTGVDYADRTTTVTFTPGDTSEDFVVSTCPDTISGEGTEDFTVTLSGPTSAALGSATATGTIIDTSLTPTQQCELLHGPGWTPVLYPNGTPWTDSGGQIVCAMPH